MYRFINKETGEIKFGKLHEANQGFDVFKTVAEDGSTLENSEEIRVENVEMNASNLTSETYIVELVN